jgi:segregation and condensation protein B
MEDNNINPEEQSPSTHQETPYITSSEDNSPIGDIVEEVDSGKEVHDLEFIPDPENLIKAMIFASPEFVTVTTLKKILGPEWDVRRIRACIKIINDSLRIHNEPFEVIEVNNSFRYRTQTQYYPWVKQLFKESNSRRLSPAALEILSIVAYKQPITKAEVEEIRGVNVDSALKGLLDRKLIAIIGKSDKIGGAYNYGTTKEFMQYFGINNVPSDLPKLSEFEELISSSALLPQMSPEGNMVAQDQNEVEENE